MHGSVFLPVGHVFNKFLLNMLTHGCTFSLYSNFAVFELTIFLVYNFVSFVLM